MCDPDDLGMMLAEGMMLYSTMDDDEDEDDTVSYTHLTLPTICSV